VGFMRGNRDFLVGAHFLNQCQVHDLQDPTVLRFASHSALLSHGDEGCLEDTDYQTFRAMVRQSEWQNSFLAKPLAEREAIARQLRDQSEQHKQDPHRTYADVDNAWSVARLEKTGATCLIHGHTHQPANHTLGKHDQFQRYVLSDWDCHTSLPRAEVLRWHASGEKERINPLNVSMKRQ
jgi:UDP-2,3-diacylglucosamine hydrolase